MRALNVICSCFIVFQLNQTHYNKLIHQLSFSEGQQIIVKTSTMGSYVSTMDVSMAAYLFIPCVFSKDYYFTSKWHRGLAAVIDVEIGYNNAMACTTNNVTLYATETQFSPSPSLPPSATD